MAILLKNSFPYIQRIPLTASRESQAAFFNLLGLALGSSRTVDCRTVEGQAGAYLNCPAVNTIINKKARAKANGKWWIVDENDDEPGNVKSLPFYSLLQRPNPYQTWDDFVIQYSIYKWLFGHTFIFCLRPEGSYFRDAKNVKAMYILPNWMVEPVMTGKFMQQSDIKEIVTGWKLTVNNVSITVDYDDVLMIRDASANLWTDQKTMLLGQSRLYPMSNIVNNVTAAYEGRNVLITRRGALGILSNNSKDSAGHTPLMPGEKEKVQKEWQSYGMAKELYQVIITNANLKWQQIAMNVGDLKLFEEVEAGNVDIANALEYPVYLLGYKNNSIYNNYIEAKKSLYADTLMPDSETDGQAFADYFGLSAMGLRVICSFDHLDVFQKSKKEEAEARLIINQANSIAYERQIITREEWRTSLDMDPKKFSGTTFFEGQQSNEKPPKQ